MAEVWFYHLSQMALERVLPDLCEKVIERGWKAFLHCENDTQMALLSNALWGQKPLSFIAHGLQSAEFSTLQPILLGAEIEQAQQRDVYLSACAQQWPDLSGYVRAILIFKDQDSGHLDWARKAWGQLKAEGHALSYWQQDENGKWFKKTSS